MRGICGIDVDRDKIFLSFAAVSKGQPLFLGESVVTANFDGKSFSGHLKEYSPLLEKAIKEKEKENSIKVEKIFLNLPWGLERHFLIEESYPFKGRRKVATSDITLAKKYIENSVLDWDDRCLHHFALGYEIEGIKFNRPPLGVMAKKIKLNSMIISIKDQVYKDVEEVFNNMDRIFGGFVVEGVSAMACAFNRLSPGAKTAVINICYDATYCMAYCGENILFGREFPFGFKNVFSEIEKRFGIPAALAEEIFERYVTFKETLNMASASYEPVFDKDVTIKNGESYVNISTLALNNFLRNYIQENIQNIVFQVCGSEGFLEENKKKLNSSYAVLAAKDGLSGSVCLLDASVSRHSSSAGSLNIEEISGNWNLAFAGRLCAKEGFNVFMRSILAADIQLVPSTGIMSTSFGCLRYGLNRFLENDHLRFESFMQKILKIYREYF